MPLGIGEGIVYLLGWPLSLTLHTLLASRPSSSEHAFDLDLSTAREAACPTCLQTPIFTQFGSCPPC